MSLARYWPKWNWHSSIGNHHIKLLVCFEHSIIEKHKEKVSINRLIKCHICLNLSLSLTLKNIPSGVPILWTPYFSSMSSHSMAQLAFYLFGENMIIRKDLELPLIFVLFLRENKINKKTLSVIPYLEKTVCGKSKSGLGVRLLIGKVQ